MRLPGEDVAGLGALLADHDVAFIEQNAILAHLEAILADQDAIWANNNSLWADRRMPWKRKIDFVVIFRLSEALVCFRASRDNFLRSATRAIVNKNVGKRKIDLLTFF